MFDTSDLYCYTLLCTLISVTVMSPEVILSLLCALIGVPSSMSYESRIIKWSKIFFPNMLGVKTPELVTPLLCGMETDY